MSTQFPHHASIVDSGGELRIDLDVADFTPAELNVEIDGPSLSVTGFRPAIGPFELEEHLAESLRLPANVDPEGARATYAGGALEIRIPKRHIAHRVVPIHQKHVVNGDATPC